MKVGEVYLPQEATRALQHFFSNSNLSALRELALTRAAQAVDAQMLDHVRAQGVGGTWAGAERIVVAINDLPGADRLVHAAKRVADGLRGPWTALFIETPRVAGFSPSAVPHCYGAGLRSTDLERWCRLRRLDRPRPALPQRACGSVGISHDWK